MRNNIYDFRTQKRKILQMKADKLDFIKIINFCLKGNVKKRKKSQTTNWEKIFTEQISDKGLVFKIYKELSFKTQ